MVFRLTADMPSCSIRREEDFAFDDDEYLCKLKYKYPNITLLTCVFYEHPLLVCDDCNKLHHGECPVFGPLSELDPTAGYDQASLAYTHLPVPAQLTVRPSQIPGAGLGVFANTFISKGVRMGPYNGKLVDKDDMGDLHNTSNAGEVRNGVFVCMEDEKFDAIYER